MWIMIVGEHGCHDAIGQRAVGKMANLLLVTLEAMLTAMEILEQKALEIAEAVENERGHLAGQAMFVFFPLFFAAEQFEQGLALEAAEARASIPAEPAGVAGGRPGGVRASVIDVAEDMRGVVRVEDRIDVANAFAKVGVNDGDKPRV